MAEELREAEELPIVNATSTSVLDPMNEIGFDHGMCSCSHALSESGVQH